MNLSEGQVMARPEAARPEPIAARPIEEDCEVECDDRCCKESSPGKIRDVNINQVNYGYIVKIGCQTFAFETAERLIEKLGLYLKEPNKTERSWYDGTLL